MKDNQASDTSSNPTGLLQSSTSHVHRILVVEDDHDIRQTNAELLMRSGYQVDSAEDGAAGWAALGGSHYDLLITDNNMPNLSGLELVDRLRAAHMPVPVILASGGTSDAELNQHPSLHLAANLQKPFTGTELLETVKEVLRARDTGSQPIGQMSVGQNPAC
jgi:DNA-binding response OmpR family regulator